VSARTPDYNGAAGKFQKSRRKNRGRSSRNPNRQPLYSNDEFVPLSVSSFAYELCAQMNTMSFYGSNIQQMAYQALLSAPTEESRQVLEAYYYATVGFTHQIEMFRQYTHYIENYSCTMPDFNPRFGTTESPR
jgi:hypothetical protein